MRLSREVGETLLLIGGFLFVVGCGYVTMRLWPTHEYGNWRLFVALIVSAALAIPVTLSLRKRLYPSDDTDSRS